MRWLQLTAALSAMAPLAFADGALALDHKRKSAFSTFEVKDCKILKRHPDGNAYRCPGLPGYPIYFAEGDLRAFVSFGPDGEKRRAAEQTLGPFNSPFDKAHPRATVEWRVRTSGGRAVPHATILRYFVSRDGKRSEAIVVTRIGERDACHVAYIDAVANKDAIASARRIADETAPGFDCKAEPRIEGAPGLVGG